MSLKEDREELIRRYRIEIIRILEKFWKTKQNIYPEEMPQKNNKYKRIIKENMDILRGEHLDKKEKFMKSNYKQLKKSSSTKSLNNLSEKALTILNKIGRNIRKIENSLTDITKMNGLFFEKKARKTFSTGRLNRKNKLDKLNLKEEFLLDNLLKKDKEKNKDSVNDNFNNLQVQNKENGNKFKKLSILNDLNSNEEKRNETKKENYMKNFIFVNDNYRKQLNLAFMKYNKDQHLENLKSLVKADPLIRRDVSTIIKEVEEDIKWRCDKFHFRKKYEMIKKRFQRSNSVQSTPKEQNKERNLLPNIKPKKTIIFSPRFSQNKFLNILGKKKREENLKNQLYKEDKIEEINHMLKASSEINNLIKDENINKKIDLYKTHYEERQKLNEFYETNSTNYIEKDYFEEEKKNIVNKLGDIYQFQVAKNTQEKENKLKGKILKDNDDFNIKLLDEKTDALNEINDIIHDNILL